MLGCKKMDFELKNPFQSCKACEHKHRRLLEFGDIYRNHNGEDSPNCMWVDPKWRPKEVKFGAASVD